MKKLIYILIVFTNQLHAIDVEDITKKPEDIEFIKAIIPIFSQKISFYLPINWKPAFQDHKDDLYMIEFIPKNETIESWKSLILVQGVKDMSSKGTAKEYLEILSLRFKSICGGEMIYESIGDSSIDGYKAYSAIIGCAEMSETHQSGVKKGQSEVGYFISIQGEKDIYLIHKSIRGEAFKIGESPLSQYNYKEFVANLFPIELCLKSGSQVECIKE